jgi:uroporphyrinogen-III synthase
VTGEPASSAGFRGARIALLEARLATETAAMVRRLGGVPVIAPALAEEALDADAEVAAFVDRLLADNEPLVVFLTGSAASRLFAIGERLGRSADLTAGLRRAIIVARGPKPTGALSRGGVTASVAVAEPYTTADVIASLATVVVDKRSTTVVHYGERNLLLLDALVARGAIVSELMLYEWRLPADTAPLARAIDDLLTGAIPVLAFTSQVQVRHLFHVAGPERRDRLVAVLNERVLVGAVGPTCAAAVRAAGIDSPIVPKHPKLAPMLNALALAHAARRRGDRTPT